MNKEEDYIDKELTQENIDMIRNYCLSNMVATYGMTKLSSKRSFKKELFNLEDFLEICILLTFEGIYNSKCLKREVLSAKNLGEDLRKEFNRWGLPLPNLKVKNEKKDI